MTPESGSDAPHWTLPPRKEISPDNLHISSFVIARNGQPNGKAGQSVLLLKAGDKHTLSFRRGRLMLPAAILRYGEKPREGARRVLRDQLVDPNPFKDPEFLQMQSYLGAHWDIVILFETWPGVLSAEVKPKEPFVHAAFYDLDNLPRSEIAEDHLEVLEEMLEPSES